MAVAARKHHGGHGYGGHASPAGRAARARQAPAAERKALASRRAPSAAAEAEGKHIYRASQRRRTRASRARFWRTFVFCTICLALLGAGRVTLSFAVFQKTLQTDTVVSQQRRVSDDNALLREEVAKKASTVRVRAIAEGELGLVDANHVAYPKALRGGPKRTTKPADEVLAQR